MSDSKEEIERSPSPSKSASQVRSASSSKSPSPKRSRSASPESGQLQSKSRSRSRSLPRRSRSRSPDASNPGNNLYVTGLSTRVTETDLEKFFSKEGKVLECSLVRDPRSKESRGFAFVTMETAEDANRCIKHLNRAVLEGRLVTVEKAKRARGRTPTPGRYQGVREKQRGGRDRGRSRSFSPRRGRYDRDRGHYGRERGHYDRERGHYDRDPYSRDRRARSPYGRRADDYPSSYRRHR